MMRGLEKEKPRREPGLRRAHRELPLTRRERRRAITWWDRSIGERFRDFEVSS